MPKKVKKAKKISAYVITTTGQGDTCIDLVDKETWDWIFSPWVPPSTNRSSYVDLTCPLAVLARMRKEDPDAEPYITYGSYQNDRALQVQPVYGTTFYSMKEAMQYVTKHKIKIVYSWEGCIY